MASPRLWWVEKTGERRYSRCDANVADKARAYTVHRLPGMLRCSQCRGWDVIVVICHGSAVQRIRLPYELLARNTSRPRSAWVACHASFGASPCAMMMLWLSAVAQKKRTRLILSADTAECERGEAVCRVSESGRTTGGPRLLAVLHPHSLFIGSAQHVRGAQEPDL